MGGRGGSSGVGGGGGMITVAGKKVAPFASDHYHEEGVWSQQDRGIYDYEDSKVGVGIIKNGGKWTVEVSTPDKRGDIDWLNPTTTIKVNTLKEAFAIGDSEIKKRKK